MTDHTIYTIALTAITVALVTFAAFWRQRQDAKRHLHARTPADNRRCIDATLKQLNSRAEWLKEEDELTGHFTYQGGNFGVKLTKTSPYARLTYLFCYETPLDYIELVRHVCNLCNMNTETCRLVYSVNEEKGTVDLHIVSMLLLPENDAHEIIVRAMDNVFHWHHTFVLRFNEQKESSEKVMNHDAEKSAAAWKRELFLIHEQEMMHQEGGPEWHAEQGSPVLLRNVLASTLSLTDIVPGKLTLTRHNDVKVVEDADDILNFDISTALIANGEFADVSSVAMLDYYDPRNPIRLRHLTMGFTQEGKTDDTLYYRLTLGVTPLSVSRTVDTHDLEHERIMRSVLMGYDLTPADKRMEEFRYIWKEAQAKMHSRKTEDLTDDERLLQSIANPRYGQMLLRGRALYEQERFYESVALLENLYHQMQGAFDRMGQTTRNTFYEICYLVGSCYLHLGQHQRACQYLQVAIPTRRITYTEAFVNSLVNGNDFRAMYYIDTFLMEAQTTTDTEQNEENAEESHGIRTFVNFLKRRKAYLLVSREQYDEAETLLKQLLKEHANSDFALKELAYIQKKKQK